MWTVYQTQILRLPDVKQPYVQFSAELLYSELINQYKVSILMRQSGEDKISACIQ